ncbi:hypothetical protein GU927_000795 [Rhodobacteraceae bacterium HSP-20]|uniref:NADP transhydrogenase beta-like domain-containing protein n=1 Tax=Paragemmobacter amnigenus TaxID=2852097 RepID=A0ABS6J1N3_9RHOB|nr:hypothetical protein [Rhodobacter amnigenus]MBU9696372.1 hypothetical protein [Rhodobacter amnigenus]MBV4387599.1 hypothetical protein [Rhodobacter amnigenus]
MHYIANGTKGLSVIMVVNSDRIFTVGTMIAGLLAGAFIGTSLLGH